MKQNLNRYVANIAKTTLKTSAPTTPQKIIFFLFLGTKFAAIKPIIIALSAAKIISIKIICNSIKDCSINLKFLLFSAIKIHYINNFNYYAN